MKNLFRLFIICGLALASLTPSLPRAQADTHRYLLTTPIQVNSEFSKAWRNFYYVRLFLAPAIQAGLAYMAKPELALALGTMGTSVAINVATNLPSTYVEQAVWLGHKFRQQLAPLNELPGLKKMQVISGTSYGGIEGIVVMKGQMKGLALIETEDALPEAELAKWNGDLVALTEFPEARMSLKFRYGEQVVEQTWEIAGTDLSSTVKIPEDVYTAWKAAYEDATAAGTEMAIDADLHLSGERVIELGPVFEGPLVKKFFKKGIVSMITRPALTAFNKLFGRPEAGAPEWKPATYPRKFLKIESAVHDRVVRMAHGVSNWARGARPATATPRP